MRLQPPALGEVKICGLQPAALAARAQKGRGLILGVAGGIGAGKSTVTAVLAKAGALVVDADKIGHQILESDGAVQREIAQRFGPSVFVDGHISRPALAATVFSQPQALADLNVITHPRIRRCALAALEKVPAGQLAVYDAAILVEARMHDLVDALAVVTAPTQRRIELLGKHRGMNPEQAQARIDNQMPDAERAAYAQVVIYNYASKAALESAVEQWASQLLAALAVAGDEEGSTAASILEPSGQQETDQSR